jgi:hypothetical protein
VCDFFICQACLLRSGVFQCLSAQLYPSYFSLANLQYRETASNFRIPDDHIFFRRSALFRARSALDEARDEKWQVNKLTVSKGARNGGTPLSPALDPAAPAISLEQEAIIAGEEGLAQNSSWRCSRNRHTTLQDVTTTAFPAHERDHSNDLLPQPDHHMT